MRRLVKKHKLDQQAESKLCDVLSRWDEEKQYRYYKDLGKVLADAVKPSATVMIMVKKIVAGERLCPSAKRCSMAEAPALVLSYWVDGRQALGHCSSSGFACSGGDRKNEQYGLRPHVLIRLQLLLSLWSLRRGWKQQRQQWRPKAKAAKLRAAGDGDYCRPALIKWMMGAGCSPQKGSFASKMGCHGMPLYESTRITLNQADASHKPTPSHS
ncbi:unnamed protein product [Effrenium voratum]|nr:unnamed protein product [Effrenium voratum]